MKIVQLNILVPDPVADTVANAFCEFMRNLDPATVLANPHDRTGAQLAEMLTRLQCIDGIFDYGTKIKDAVQCQRDQLCGEKERPGRVIFMLPVGRPPKADRLPSVSPATVAESVKISRSASGRMHSMLGIPSRRGQPISSTTVHPRSPSSSARHSMSSTKRSRTTPSSLP